MSLYPHSSHWQALRSQNVFAGHPFLVQKRMKDKGILGPLGKQWWSLFSSPHEGYCGHFSLCSPRQLFGLLLCSISPSWLLSFPSPPATCLDVETLMNSLMVSGLFPQAFCNFRDTMSLPSLQKWSPWEPLHFLPCPFLPNQISAPTPDSLHRLIKSSWSLV